MALAGHGFHVLRRGHHRAGFPTDRLTFEFVETETIADTAHLINIIREYRLHGFKIALDDFEPGYSGLLRLADLKPDIVKIDRATVKGCDEDPMRRTIITSLLSLGKATGTKIVIEGM